MDTVRYVTEEEYNNTVAVMQERIRKREVQNKLRAGWRANGCALTLAQKLELLNQA